MLTRAVYLTLIAALLFGAAAVAEPATFQVTFKNRAFTETSLTIPANTKLKRVVKNEDAAPAEFESTDLSREMVVPARASVVIYISPLPPGKYNFFNDFNHAAQAWIVVNPLAATPKTENQ
ncbi:MAG: cupredoxin domain-containing protein [Gammaproteobacteria bacterium]